MTRRDVTYALVSERPDNRDNVEKFSGFLPTTYKQQTIGCNQRVQTEIRIYLPLTNAGAKYDMPHDSKV